MWVAPQPDCNPGVLTDYEGSILSLHFGRNVQNPIIDFAARSKGGCRVLPPYIKMKDFQKTVQYGDVLKRPKRLVC